MSTPILQSEFSPNAVRSNSFTVTIDQHLIDEDTGNAHVFPMPVLSKAVKIFNFDTEIDYETDEDEEEDAISGFDVDDDDNSTPSMMMTEFGRLVLHYEVTRESLMEIKKLVPVPDDCQFVVRINFTDNQGNDVFYHEFRGVFDILVPEDANGSLVNPGMPLLNTLVLECEDSAIFSTNY